LVIVYNPSTNSNNVFLALNRDATTAAVTGQTVVSPGQYAFFILTLNDNGSGIQGIAATGNTVVTVFRQSFRTLEERNSIMGGAFGGALAAQFWVAISGTQVQLSGPFVEARTDTLRNKTAATAMQVTVQNIATEGLSFGPVGTGAGLVSVGPSNNDYFRVAANSQTVQIAAARSVLFASTGTVFDEAATRPVQVANTGGADPRHTLSSTAQVLHTPVAGGNTNSTFQSFEFPITNGSVVVIGDTVEFGNNGSNRVNAAGIGSANIILGVALAGGTGNAGGTVFARVAVSGFINTVVADTGGVTALQYVKPGANTANRVISTAALAVNSFGRCNLTAIAGAVTSIFLGRA